MSQLHNVNIGSDSFEFIAYWWRERKPIPYKRNKHRYGR